MRFLTIQEAAEMCRVSEITIRRWVQAGKVPATKPGKFILIDEYALGQFIRSGDIAPDIAGYVAAIVAAAPELSADQLARLRDALGQVQVKSDAPRTAILTAPTARPGRRIA